MVKEVKYIWSRQMVLCMHNWSQHWTNWSIAFTPRMPNHFWSMYVGRYVRSFGRFARPAGSAYTYKLLVERLVFSALCVYSSQDHLTGWVAKAHWDSVCVNLTPSVIPACCDTYMLGQSSATPARCRKVPLAVVLFQVSSRRDLGLTCTLFITLSQSTSSQTTYVRMYVCMCIDDGSLCLPSLPHTWPICT